MWPIEWQPSQCGGYKKQFTALMNVHFAIIFFAFYGCIRARNVSDWFASLCCLRQHWQRQFFFKEIGKFILHRPISSELHPHKFQGTLFTVVGLGVGLRWPRANQYRLGIISRSRNVIERCIEQLLILSDKDILSSTACSLICTVSTCTSNLDVPIFRNCC